MFLGSCPRELERRITAGHHGRPGVLLTRPHKRLEQSHLCSGPSDKIKPHGAGNLWERGHG